MSSMSLLVGKVTAGLPITAIENIEEFFPLPERLAPADEQYLCSRLWVKV